MTQTVLRVALLIFVVSESAGAADKVRISVSSLDAAFLTPIAVKEAKVTRSISANDVSDLTMLREAQKELGIKGR
jgi:hypothetical protein